MLKVRKPLLIAAAALDDAMKPGLEAHENWYGKIRLGNMGMATCEGWCGKMRGKVRGNAVGKHRQ